MSVTNIAAAVGAAVLVIVCRGAYANQLGQVSIPKWTVTAEALTKAQHQEIENLVTSTLWQLDTTQPNSLVAQLNAKTLTSLPNWLYHAIERCEWWHKKTEGKFSCRNGNLKQYWQDVAVGVAPEVERREARKRARIARIAEVTLTGETRSISFSNRVIWDLSELSYAVIVQRILDYLAAHAITRYHVNVDTLHAYSTSGDEVSYGNALLGEQQHISLPAFVSYELIPWQRPVITNSKKMGVISHNDGWYTAMFASHAVTNNPIDSMVIAYLAAANPSQYVMDLLNDDQHLALLDQQHRRYFSRGYLKAMGVNSGEKALMKITVELPTFNVADYQGPYAAVWLTDADSHLVRNLHIRGSAESWLKSLRTWWRKVARKDDALIDAMSGATMGSAPVEVTWDGLDQYGNAVNPDGLTLHVEVAREHGSRSYKRIALSELIVHGSVKGDGELASVTISR